MRHSKIDLTMNVYTDPRLLDVRGALDVLPALPLHDDQRRRKSVLVTGADDACAGTVAPPVAPTLCNGAQPGSLADNAGEEQGPKAGYGDVAESGTGDKRRGPLTTPVGGPAGVGATGLEPVPPSLSSWCSSHLS